MINMEIFNTKDELFVWENYFTTFIYETLESTSGPIRSDINLSSIQYQKSRWSKMRRNQHSVLTSENFYSNLLINKNKHFHICFIENFKLTQFSTTVYNWGEQEYCDGTIIFYYFFSPHYSPCYMREKGKECKERYGFRKKDSLLENKNLTSFSLNLLVGNVEHLSICSFLGRQHSCATKIINWYGDSI